MDGEAIRKDGERTAWKMTWIATWTAWMDEKKNEKFRPSTFKNHQSFIHKVLTTVQQNTRVRQNKVESCCSTPANNGYPIITEAH